MVLSALFWVIYFNKNKILYRSELDMAIANSWNKTERFIWQVKFFNSNFKLKEKRRIYFEQTDFVQSLSCLYGVRNRRRFSRRMLKRRLSRCRRRRRNVVLLNVTQTFASQCGLLWGDDVVEGMLLDRVADHLQPKVALLGRAGTHSEIIR